MLELGFDVDLLLGSLISSAGFPYERRSVRLRGSINIHQTFLFHPVTSGKVRQIRSLLYNASSPYQTSTPATHSSRLSCHCTDHCCGVCLGFVCHHALRPTKSEDCYEARHHRTGACSTSDHCTYTDPVQRSSSSLSLQHDRILLQLEYQCRCLVVAITELGGTSPEHNPPVLWSHPTRSQAPVVGDIVCHTVSDGLSAERRVTAHYRIGLGNRFLSCCRRLAASIDGQGDRRYCHTKRLAIRSTR